MKIEDFRPIRSQDSAPIKFDWLLMQESDWIIWTNQKITLMIFWLVKNGKDWNLAIPLVKRIFLVPDHIWPKTIKGQPALTHVIRNYVLLLVVPPLCLWWVTHIVTKALRLKILPGQQLPLFPNPPTLLTVYFNVKIQEHLRFVGRLTVVIQTREWRLIACVVMVTSWGLFVVQNMACHPVRLKLYRYIQKYQTQLYICRSMTSMCQVFFVVCVYMHINPD